MHAAMNRAITAIGKREETNQSDQMSGIGKLLARTQTEYIRVSNSSTVLNNSGYSG
jgi:hypothetical protein